MSHPARFQAAALLLCAWPAWPHAILLDAAPASHQVVNGKAIPIKLRFNSRIDGKRSKVTLVGPDGRERPLAMVKQSAPDTLTGKVEGLSPGAYILRWQVLAADGHITRGEVPFQTQ
jgi:copper resistance protein C